MTFARFMREGGFGMVPLLLFGLILLGAGIWFAVRPHRRALAFTAAMWLLVFTSMMHAMLMNVSAVMRALQEGRNYAHGAGLAQFLGAGLKESSRPGAMGGIFLSLATLAVAVGVFRRRFWEPAVVAAKTPAHASAAPAGAAPAAPRA
jgi:hypothetical protein